MSDFDALAQRLQPSAGTLTLAADTLPGTHLADFLRDFCGGNALAIAVAQHAATAPTVTLSGTCSLLGVAGLAVTGTFTQGSAGVDVELGFGPLPDTWRFSQSFPELPPFTDYGQPPASSAYAALDRLALHGTTFTFRDSSAPGSVYGGLGLASSWTPTGALALFEELVVGTQALDLSGTIRRAPPAGDTTQPLPPFHFPWDSLGWPVPGIQLTAPLAGSKRVGELEVSLERLRAYCPPTFPWWVAHDRYDPTIAVEGSLRAGELSCSFVAELLEGSRRVVLNWRSGAPLSQLAHLAPLLGTADVPLPPALLDALGEIELIGGAFGVTAVLGPQAFDSGYVVLGAPKAKPWTIVKGLLEVSEPTVELLVENPLAGVGSPVSVVVGGVLTLLDRFPCEVRGALPGGLVTAELLPTTSPPTVGELLGRFVPELAVPFAKLTIDTLELAVEPSVSYSFSLGLADAPHPWELDLGPAGLTVSGVTVDVLRAAGGGSWQAAIGGTIAFADEVGLELSYSLPGPFLLRGQLPSISLTTLIDELSPVPLPKGFEIELADTYVLIQEAGTLSLDLGTSVEGLGTLAMRVQRAGSGWGFAAGFDLDVTDLADLATRIGLDILQRFVSFCGLTDLMLVVTTGGAGGFTFPDMAAFQVPELSTKPRFQLPPQASNQAGAAILVYADLQTARSKPFARLLKFFGVDLSLDVGVALSVSVPDPLTDSRLSVHVDLTPGDESHPLPLERLSGQVGGLVMAQGTDVAVYAEVDAVLKIGGQEATFALGAQVQEDGVMLSGALEAKGDHPTGPIHIGTLQLESLELSLGLEVDTEVPVPSVGVAAQLTLGGLDGSVAVFFDADNPLQSLVAGSISSLTLGQAAELLARQALSEIPAAVRGALNKVGLSGKTLFTLPAALRDPLSKRDVGALAKAFAQASDGSIQLPTSCYQLLLAVDDPSRTNPHGDPHQPGWDHPRWFVTDLTAPHPTHYALTLTPGGIEVALEPQLYLAVLPTQIGPTGVGQLYSGPAFFVSGQLDLFAFAVSAEIDIDASKGLSCDVEVEELTVYRPEFFRLTGADGKGSPHLSLSTFQNPHFQLTGALQLLGRTCTSLDIEISESGVLVTAAMNAAGVDLSFKGVLSGRQGLDVTISGSVHVGGSLDLGPLGSVDVSALTVTGSGALSWAGGERPSAHYQFSATVGPQTFPNLDLALDVDVGALADVADRIRDVVRDEVRRLVGDADHWLAWVASGAIAGLKADANRVGQLLRSPLGVGVAQVASKVHAALGYGTAQTAKALKGASATAEQAAAFMKPLFSSDPEGVARALTGAWSGLQDTTVAKYMKEANFSPGQVAKVLRNVFGWHSAKRLAKFLHGSLGVSKHDLQHALSIAGVPAKDIKNALSSLWHDLHFW